MTSYRGCAALIAISAAILLPALPAAAQIGEWWEGGYDYTYYDDAWWAGAWSGAFYDRPWFSDTFWTPQAGAAADAWWNDWDSTGDETAPTPQPGADYSDYYDWRDAYNLFGANYWEGW